MIKRGLSVGLGLAFLAVQASAASVMDMVNQVSQSQYTSYLDSKLYTHNGDNRHADTGPQHDPARDNIASFFTGLGLTTGIDHWSLSGYTGDNVVAELTGVTHPDWVYVVGGHYDSVGNPGADDDASGVAGVMEAARVLSQYQFDATIRFVAFDHEEQGLIGSQAYANAHASDSIKGMISLDMIAFNNGGNNKAHIFGRSASNPWKDLLATSIGLYGNGVTATLHDQFDASDQAPFEWKGFQAALLIEDYSGNGNYHQPTDSFDTAGYLDFQFATNLTRSAVGCLATAASPVPEPATLAALGLGVALLIKRRRR